LRPPAGGRKGRPTAEDEAIMTVALKRQAAAEDALREARVDLAAALHLAVKFDYHEGVDNHFSLAVPGDRYLINPNRIHWSELRASDLLLLDTKGQLIEGASPPEPTAFFIHGAIHKANPRARCVLHTHMPYATALTLLAGGRLEPVSQTAMKFWNDIAYDDLYQGLVLDEAEGDRIAAALGQKRILFLANHGVIVVGRSVAEAFNDLYYLERAAQLQVLAGQMGKPLRPIPLDIADVTSRQMQAETTEQAEMHFAALKRILDREGSIYAE
jgi:ribulose-5-phosphate 4-epimerase/fuculose-1-phosphate aldolase